MGSVGGAAWPHPRRTDEHSHAAGATKTLAASIRQPQSGESLIMTGKVYLVGAGPGDPELLTRKAWRVLQSADVVLHDDLVPQELLRVLPVTAQVVNVGKRCGMKNISQNEINALMVRQAREGKIVARLKS